MSIKKPKTTLVLLLYIGLAIPILSSYVAGPEQVLEAPPLPRIDCQNDGGSLQLDCPAPPNTNLTEQPDFDLFAWNTFIALNWPAVVPDKTNGFRRGFPDLTKNFVGAAPEALTVWETFKEKREVFNHGGNDPGPWNQDLNYGPIRSAEGDKNTTQRTFHQGSKLFFDSFDETVEVASEALEEKLTDGSANPVLGKPVGPRVWLGLPAAGNPVVYEVKVNFDFYQYVRDHKFYVKNDQPGNPIQLAAEAGRINLPYRTSADGGPRAQQPETGHTIKTKYSSLATANAYQNPPANSNPPLIGAVHLKAAWMKLSSAEDDLDQFHWTIAQYFVSENGKPTPKSDTFGLIGLHIIQRIHTGGSSNTTSDPRGGTFVFATWEHIENDSIGFTYSNYYPDPDSTNNPPRGFYPPKTKPYPVVRRPNAILPNTKKVNKMVHDAIKASTPRGSKPSVWLNYRLIGTQFVSVDLNDRPVSQNPKFPPSIEDPSGIGQPFYLANLVVETNEGLQRFQGIPPNTLPILRYQGVGVEPNLGTTFERNAKNMSFVRVARNMGGCMGCHGVAQNRGYSFSFVLMGGYAEAVTDTQSDFEVPPGPGPKPKPQPKAKQKGQSNQ